MYRAVPIGCRIWSSPHFNVDNRSPKRFQYSLAMEPEKVKRILEFLDDLQNVSDGEPSRIWTQCGVETMRCAKELLSYL
jgi:hypothetical protein